MSFSELKDALKAYIDEITGDTPSERDIEILGLIEDYAEPEGISEDEINARINEAVEANTAEWTKKFKDRFYGRDQESKKEDGEDQTVENVDVVENEPEQEELKSVLDYEW